MKQDFLFSRMFNALESTDITWHSCSCFQLVFSESIQYSVLGNSRTSIISFQICIISLHMHTYYFKHWLYLFKLNWFIFSIFRLNLILIRSFYHNSITIFSVKIKNPFDYIEQMSTSHRVENQFKWYVCFECIHLLLYCHMHICHSYT